MQRTNLNLLIGTLACLSFGMAGCSNDAPLTAQSHVMDKGPLDQRIANVMRRSDLTDTEKQNVIAKMKANAVKSK